MKVIFKIIFGDFSYDNNICDYPKVILQKCDFYKLSSKYVCIYTKPFRYRRG